MTYSSFIRRMSCSSLGITALLIALTTAGCQTPARLDSQSMGSATGTPTGLYRATIHIPGGGELTGSTSTYIAVVENSAQQLRANGRANMLGELVGGFRGVWLDSFGLPGLPGGTAFAWHCEQPDEAGLRQGNMHIPGVAVPITVTSADEPIGLYFNRSETPTGAMTLTPIDSIPATDRDYVALVEQFKQIIAAAVFDPELLKTPSTQSFIADLEHLGTVARDDLEFTLGWLIADNQLEFSHLSLSRQLDPNTAPAAMLWLAKQQPARDPEQAEPDPLPRPAISVLTTDGITTMRIPSMTFTIDQYDEAIDEFFVQEGLALIIDLRGNPGGSYHSARIAAHLIDQPLNAGYVYTSQGRAQVFEAPDEAITAFSIERPMADFQATLRQKGVVRLEARPQEPSFDGPVAVLIDGNSASAAEAFAAGMQETGRAKLFGQTTAGAVLSISKFELDGGWRLWVPTGDFVTAGRKRLEGIGVTPDFPCEPEEAEDMARQYLREQLQTEPAQTEQETT
jgi:hypothetical protein